MLSLSLPCLGDARFLAVAENIAPCIFVQDRAGKFVFVNRSLLRWLERPEADVLGKTSRQVWPPSVAAKDELDLALVFAGARLETEEQRPRAGQMWNVRSLKVPVCDKQGRVIEALTHFHELPANTARRLADVVVVQGPREGLVVSTVLVVERDPQVRRLTQLLLERGGHEVLLTASAAEARQLLEQEASPPDLILLDQGYAAKLSELIERAPGAEVVLTCVTAPGELTQQQRAQIAGLLSKPYAADTLLLAVGDVLKRHAHRDPGLGSPPCEAGHT